MSTTKPSLPAVTPARRALPLATSPATTAHEAHHHAPGACDCGHDHTPRSGTSDAGFWASIGPVLACAVCPACLSTYAKVFAATGVGFALTEGQHHLFLALALGSSLAFSAHRSWRTRRATSLVIALVGAALVFAGHSATEVPWLGWVGVAVLLVGGLAERRMDPARSARAPLPAPRMRESA
jgi:hypothetical protein